MKSSALLGLLLSVLSGCNYVLEFESAQCSTTSDCQALGSGFEDRVCRAGSCVLPSSSTSDPNGNGAAGAAGSGGGAGAAAQQGCVSTTQCVAEHLGEPYVCRSPGEPCTALTSSECPLVFGDFDSDAAVYFGAFLNVPASAPLSQMSALNVKLAIDEFNGSVGGLPGGPLGKLRPIVAVVCRNEPALVSGAADHLIDNVGVPAVLAHLPSAELKEFFANRAAPAQLFVMNPGFADNSLTTLSNAGLFWHVIGDIRDVAPTYGPLLQRVETAAAPSSATRVAMLVSKRYAEQSIADSLVPVLRFNGKSVTQNGNDFYTAAVPALADEPDADYSAINAAVLDFKPHVVVALTREEFVYKMLPAIEGAWDSAAPGQGRPFYVLPTALSGNLDLLNYIAQDSDGTTSEDKRTRMVGVAPASAEDLTLYNQFLVRFRTAYPRFQNPGGFENFYDAVYLLANAMYAAGSVPTLNGTDIARGMQRVVSGATTINVGPTTIADGFAALAAGGSIRLQGTMGLADFDPGVGARRGNGSVYCVKRDSGLVSFEYDVLRFERGTNTLSGEFTCFSGL